MLPILVGLGIGAALGGGIAALQKKDILQGALMGGIGGALGGAFAPAAGGVAGGAAGTPASAATAVNAFESALPGVADTVVGAGGQAGVGAMAPMGTLQAGTSGIGSLSQAGMPALTSTGGAVPGSGLFSGGFGNFLGANKYALAGGALGGMMAPGEEPPGPEQGNIRDYTFSQAPNPDFGKVAGAPYFKPQTYTAGAVTPVEDYTAADGGIVALAEGGKALELAPYQPVEAQRYAAPVRTISPEVAAYNQQMMARANQQYNVNPRPLPIQVPGSPGYVAPTYNVASSAPASTGEFGYDPVTRRYTGIGGLAQKEKSELEKMREEMAALKAEQGGSMAGDSGNANGGVIGSYADGGLSSLGSYSDGGRLLKGPGDGVSDDIPAQIGDRQPARLADGEFVVPARVVSEIGNGSTDAGAKRLYAMMDRVQNARKKSVGKGKVAVDSKAHKMLPA